MRSRSDRSRSGRFRALDFVFDVRAPGEITVLADEWFADLVVNPSSPRTTPPTTRSTIDVRQRRGGWSVRDGEGVESPGDLGDAVAQVIQLVNQGALRSMTGGVCLHSAAVASDGGVVALVGVSGAGKSTLAAAAVRRGLGYVADEIVAITPEGTVRPFHRPIGLRAGGAAAVGVAIPEVSDGRFDVVYPWRPPSSALDPGGPLVGVCLVRYVSTTDGDVGPEPVGWTSVRPAEALVELSAGAFAMHVDGSDGDRARFRQLTSLVSRVPVARLTYGADVSVGVDHLVDFLASASTNRR